MMEFYHSAIRIATTILLKFFLNIVMAQDIKELGLILLIIKIPKFTLEEAI